MCKSNVLDKLAIGASAPGVSLPVICSLVFLDRPGDLVTGMETCVENQSVRHLTEQTLLAQVVVIPASSCGYAL